jgi:hypothetical protein
MQQIINYANDAVKAFHQVPPGFWQALLASGILSPLLKVWKHFRVTKKEKEIAEWAMYLITVGVAFSAALLQYLLTAHPGNPTIIALHTAILSFMLQPVYLLGVKPLWSYFSKKSAAATAFNEEVKSAAIPATGLPIAGTSVSATADTNAPDGF